MFYKKFTGSLAAFAMTVLLLPVLSACPELPNTLEGSSDELFDLNFDEVRIRQYQSTVVSTQIEYMRKSEDGSAMDIVAQITVTQPQGGFPAETDILFSQVDGHIHRIAPGDDYPALEEGHVLFHAGGNKVDEQTTGEFSAIFENRRTLHGNFDAKMTLASPD